MNKDTDNKTTAIAPGKPVKVEAVTREEAKAKVEEIREQAEKGGLVLVSRGMIVRDMDKELNPYVVTLTFDEPKNI